MTPIMDLFITLLSMGSEGFLKLINERQVWSSLHMLADDVWCMLYVRGWCDGWMCEMR